MLEPKDKFDEKLIRASKGGDLSAFEKIVKKYERLVFGYVLKLTKDEDVADDITQETFIRIFENLNRFDINRPIKPWMFRIAKNLAYDFFRKNKKLTPIEYEIEDLSEASIEKIVKKEEVKELKHALKTLPSLYKKPIVRYYFKNFSYLEISKTLKVPINTIRTRIRRGKEILSKKLNEKR